MLTQCENNEAETSEAQPAGATRRRRKKSIVWEHFTIETVSAGCRRACCKQCKQSFAYSTGSKVAGTSHLKRHLTKGSCQISHADPTQLTPYSPRRHPRRHHRPLPSPFDPDRTRHELARFLIAHGQPLRLVEDPTFLSLLHTLEPRFSVPDFPAAQDDCLSAYLREKQSVLRLLSSAPGRLSLSLDLRPSPRSAPYAFVAAHFLDPDWTPSRWLLSVVAESDACAFRRAVSEWGLDDRLFSVTAGRALTPAEDCLLRPLLSVKNPDAFCGQLVLSDCIAAALGETALELLDSGGGEVVDRVRDLVWYVTGAEAHEERFLCLRRQLQVPTEKVLAGDDRRRWDTTYHMLAAAYDLKEVFACLDPPLPEVTMEDWRRVGFLCSRLSLLHDTAELLLASTPTPNLLFQEVWKLRSELAGDGLSGRIDRYWDATHLALAAAVVVDPRFKMKLVEFSFSKVYGEGAAERVRAVEDGVRELFAEYAGEGAGRREGEAAAAAEEGGGGGAERSRLSDFDEYILETSRQQTKSELDQYLEEPLLPRVTEVDVMGWWRVNRPRYPTLARVACDLLSMAVSTVPPGEVFETARRREVEADSSLRPEMVEALLCCRDWLHHVSNPVPNAIVKVDYNLE